MNIRNKILPFQDFIPCDRRVPKSSISVEEYIPGAAKQSTQVTLQDKNIFWLQSNSIFNRVQNRNNLMPTGSTPDVTSTSTGRMMNWSSLGALVLILMYAVWLSTSLEEKLALITPFVSNGGISWKNKSSMGDNHLMLEV